MVWPVARWLMVCVIGALTCLPLGAAVSRLTGLSSAPAVLVAYINVGIALIMAVEYMHRRIGERLATLLPWGEADQYLGAGGGILSGAAICMIGLALLNPVEVSTLDWDPARMTGEQAVGALFEVILGTLRRLILEESWVGRAVQEHLGGLLISR
jgi:hypothetical protein